MDGIIVYSQQKVIFKWHLVAQIESTLVAEAQNVFNSNFTLDSLERRVEVVLSLSNRRNIGTGVSIESRPMVVTRIRELITNLHLLGAQYNFTKFQQIEILLYGHSVTP